MHITWDDIFRFCDDTADGIEKNRLGAIATITHYCKRFFFDKTPEERAAECRARYKLYAICAPACLKTRVAYQGALPRVTINKPHRCSVQQEKVYETLKYVLRIEKDGNFPNELFRELLWMMAA